MPKYQVHAYTQCGHNRVAVIDVSARSAESAREKARAKLLRDGRKPDLCTLVPVAVGASSDTLTRFL
ncbi:hypothetical protein [Burkholderia sp. SIMBA_062]|uniref:hypothetical protein n=1 Tax=Burkholderia sp. SIMBA_062 TaxID=3085803 RepID=UPI00397C6CDC